jgi:hypothetical protein
MPGVQKEQGAITLDGSLSRCGSYHPRRRRDAAALGFILLSDMIGITSFLVGWQCYLGLKVLLLQLQLSHKIRIVSIRTEKV